MDCAQHCPALPSTAHMQLLNWLRNENVMIEYKSVLCMVGGQLTTTDFVIEMECTHNCYLFKLQLFIFWSFCLFDSMSLSQSSRRPLPQSLEAEGAAN
jgi:hypothetical protein